MTKLRVLISGAGVAGPALAYWLSRAGADVTVVEVAPALRTSGSAVDFRGDTHLGLLRRMGVLDSLRAVQTHGGAMSCVDEHGTEIYRLPAEFAGGDIEVLRRDLSRILYERGADHVEYLFDDRITALTQDGDGVHVTFEKAAPRTADLLVGADGMHSGVRRIAFGQEADFVHHLGFYLAGWDLPNDLGLDTLSRQYNVPGRMVSAAADLRDPSRAAVLAVFAAPFLYHDWRDAEAQKRIITEHLSGLGWHVPHLLGALPDAKELYFDQIGHVRMDRWTSGRIALLGDAAWGLTLGGMGVGSGIVGGYVLAGELAATGDHRTAFAAYERRMRGYAARWQRASNPGQVLAPSTALRLSVRNAMFRSSLVKRLLARMAQSFATTLDLPDYDLDREPAGKHG
jgi:2-polyprenyl-6-methoxyphenol hydroxylase-like FAD-dependent oxidoreductase